MTRRPTPITAKSKATGQEIKYRSLAHASQEGGFCSSSITLCLRGVISSHAGFEFTTTAKLDPPRRPERVARVKELRAKGLSYAKVAKAMGLSESTVYYHDRNNAR